MTIGLTAIWWTFGWQRGAAAGVGSTDRQLRNKANTIASFATFSTTSATKESRLVMPLNPGTRSRTNEASRATRRRPDPTAERGKGALVQKNYDPSTFLRWYRKLSRHPERAP